MWDYLIAVAVGLVTYKLGKKGALYYGGAYLILSGLAQIFVDARMVEVRIFLLAAFGIWFFARYNTRPNDSGKRTSDDRKVGR